MTFLFILSWSLLEGFWLPSSGYVVHMYNTCMFENHIMHGGVKNLQPTFRKYVLAIEEGNFVEYFVTHCMVDSGYNIS